MKHAEGNARSSAIMSCGLALGYATMCGAREKGGRVLSLHCLSRLTYQTFFPLDFIMLYLQAEKLRRTIIDADARRLKRKIAHSAPGSVEVKPARKKKIIVEQE